MGKFKHPEWFEPQAEYELPRYVYARQMGQDAALGLTAEWPEAEAMLQGIWRQEPGGLSWEEARGAVYDAWSETRSRRAFD